jgi:hypothetical protein
LTDTFDEQVISEFRTRGGVVSGFQDLSLLCCITSAPSRDLNASRRSRFGRSATTPSQSLRRIEAHHDIRTGTTTWWPTQHRGDRAETWSVRARVAAAEERRNVTDRLVAEAPSVASAVGRTSRQIPVVILELLARI